MIYIIYDLCLDKAVGGLLLSVSYTAVCGDSRWGRSMAQQQRQPSCDLLWQNGDKVAGKVMRHPEKTSPRGQVINESPEVTLSAWLGYKPTINNVINLLFLLCFHIVRRLFYRIRTAHFDLQMTLKHISNDQSLLCLRQCQALYLLSLKMATLANILQSWDNRYGLLDLKQSINQSINQTLQRF